MEAASVSGFPSGWLHPPVEGEVQKLLGAVDASTHTGLRDRALLGVLAYTFARIGSVVNLQVEDYYPSGKLGKGFTAI
jgi:site-specific recombinase XerD